MPKPRHTAGKATEGVLSVRNWDRFQHYKNRCPPWIKLYNSILDEPEFIGLPDASKFHLIAIMLLASRRENRLPADPAYIRRAIHAKSTPNLCKLLELRWLEGDASNLHTNARAERETEQRRDRGETEALARGRASDRGVSSAARELVRKYETVSEHKATDATYRSAQKLLDAGHGDDLLRAVEHYEAEVQEQDRDKQYRIRPHNFFGREAKWRLYVSPTVEPTKRYMSPSEIAEFNRRQRER